MRATTKTHKKQGCCHVAYFLHFQCVGVVCGSVGVLDILQDDISLRGRLVNNLWNNKQQAGISANVPSYNNHGPIFCSPPQFWFWVSHSWCRWGRFRCPGPLLSVGCTPPRCPTGCPASEPSPEPRSVGMGKRLFKTNPFWLEKCPSFHTWM